MHERVSAPDLEGRAGQNARATVFTFSSCKRRFEKKVTQVVDRIENDTNPRREALSGYKDQLHGGEFALIRSGGDSATNPHV